MNESELIALLCRAVDKARESWAGGQATVYTTYSAYGCGVIVMVAAGEYVVVSSDPFPTRLEALQHARTLLRERLLQRQRQYEAAVRMLDGEEVAT